MEMVGDCVTTDCFMCLEVHWLWGPGWEAVGGDGGFTITTVVKV